MRIGDNDNEVLIDYFLYSLFISSIISAIILIHPIESVSALYMLSALVQSAAAIFAIGFSLSLIAIQLTAPYSFRILKFLLKDIHFRLLFLVLTVIILFGLNGSLVIGNGLITIYVKFLLLILLFLSIFMFFCLWSYFQSILNTLNPVRLINQIIDDVDLIQLETEVGPGDNNDPIQPITDILSESLRKNDENTVLHGLKSITSKMESFLEKDLSVLNQEQITKEFNYHLLIIGKRVFGNSAYINISISIIDCLTIFGIKAIDNDKVKVANQILVELKSCGLLSIGNRIESIIIKISTSIGDAERGIGFKANAKTNYDLVRDSTIALRDIGKEAVKYRLKTSSNIIIGCLRNIGTYNYNYDYSGNKRCKEKDDENSRTAVESLAAIALEANSQELTEILRKLIFDIKYIGQLSAREKFPKTAAQTADSFKYLSKDIVEMGNSNLFIIIIDALGDLGPKFAGADLNGAARSAVDALLSIIQITSDSKDLIDRNKMRIDIAKRLKDIGKIAAERNQPEVSSLAAHAFGYFSDPSEDLLGIMKSSLEEILEVSDDPNTCVSIARSINAFGFGILSMEAKVVAESAANKAISKNETHTLAYLQLCKALKSQEVLLRNQRDNDKADEKKREADRACEMYHRLNK